MLLALVASSSLTQAKSASRLRQPVSLDRPIDIDQLMSLARTQASLNARLALKYSYRQSTKREIFTDDGSVKHQQTKVHRVFPSRDGTIRHLLSVDGDDPPPKLVKKQRKRNEAIRKRWEKIRRKHQAELEKKRKRAAARSKASRQPPTTPARQQARSTPTRAATPSDPTPARSTPPPARPSTESAVARTTTPPATPTTDRLTAPSSPDSPAKATPSEQLAFGPAPPPEPPATVDPDPLPSCDLEDPRRSVRPSPDGSRKRGGGTAVGKQSRKAREQASDYSLFELLSLTEYEHLGSCELEGRPVHVVGFQPPRNFDPVNPVERVVTAMEGSILIDAAEYQVLRTSGKTVAPIRWGAGLVSLRSARILFEQRLVNDRVWLPSLDVFEFDSRVLLDRDRERTTHYYDDHQPFDVVTDEVFEGPATPEG